MKIITNDIVSLKSLILRAYSTADSINTLILIDFADCKAYLKAPNDVSICFDITVEDIDTSICDKMITDANKFLNICSMYPTLDVVNKNGKVVFVHNENEFQLSYFEDTRIIPTAIFSKDFDVESSMTIDGALERAMKLANTYLSKDPNSNNIFQHISVDGNRLASISETYDILVQDFSEQDKIDYEDCVIYRDVLDYISIVSPVFDDIETTLDITETHYIINSGDNIKIISPRIKGVVFQNIYSDNFVDFYTHETKFIVNKKRILEFLTSVKPFTSGLKNNRLDFSLKDNQLILATQGGDDKIKINFEVEDNIDMPEDFTFIFEGALFYKNLKNIEGEKITIEVHQGTKENKGVEKEAILCQMYNEDKTEKVIFKRLSNN